MREIKFRAYDPLMKKMVKLRLLDLFGAEEDLVVYGVENAHGNVAYSKRDGVPVMQSTGLFDKNGRDIYEGDILLIVEDVVVETIGGYPRTEPEGRIEEVKFKDGAFWAGDELLSEEASQGEVISNIYENEGYPQQEGCIS